MITPHEFEELDNAIPESWEGWMIDPPMPTEQDRGAAMNRALEHMKAMGWFRRDMFGWEIMGYGVHRPHVEGDFVLGISLGWAGAFDREMLDQDIWAQEGPTSEDGLCWMYYFLHLCSHIRRDRNGIWNHINSNRNRMRMGGQRYLTEEVMFELHKVWGKMPLDDSLFQNMAMVNEYLQYKPYRERVPDRNPYLLKLKKMSRTELAYQLQMVFTNLPASRVEDMPQPVRRAYSDLIATKQRWHAVLLPMFWDGRGPATTSVMLALMDSIKYDLENKFGDGSGYYHNEAWNAARESAMYRAYCRYLLDSDKFYKAKGGIFDGKVRRDFI